MKSQSLTSERFQRCIEHVICWLEGSIPDDAEANLERGEIPVKPCPDVFHGVSAVVTAISLPRLDIKHLQNIYKLVFSKLFELRSYFFLSSLQHCE